ncbi:methyl-accepting chemotaxis protein [Massilia cavernae]|uniref:HAMP domain-containing protein n=1 Tax=Massilia cavernae TaxID=2320864 RepID=A0A418XQ99_9BURK|nr:methyl-accepting chemotaxis protein [Massilia cavernae]RJG14683.1 HAMP domain-containing protein [Massilia cavernae]
MDRLRQLDTRIKIFGCLAIVLALGLATAWSLASQFGQAVEAAARPGLKAGAAAELLRAGYGGARTWLFVAGAASIGIVAALAVWLAAEVARPIHAAVLVAQRVAAGDLSARVEQGGSGESGLLTRAMQEMNDKLVSMIVNVRSGSETISSGAGEIASGSLDLSARTEQQAASLEETASSMEELTATVKQNADHAHQASKLAVSASDVAVKGGEVVSEVVGTMASINDSSKRIAEIIGVIDGIAFQTNILALNAAVEAARAGEQGRGFAVVASEVRNLAQRSAAAAREIKELIDDSVEKVSAGTHLADKAGNTMNEVVASVRRVTEIIGEIAAASAEQTTGIEQVNQAIAAMDQATQQNAALVEESAAAAASMRDQAGSLKHIIGSFVLDAEHSRPSAQIHLVSSTAKPAAPRTAAAAGDGARRIRPVAASPRAAARPGAGKRAAAAKQDVDWEEF